jgi:hypothetical protein
MRNRWRFGVVAPEKDVDPEMYKKTRKTENAKDLNKDLDVR